MRSDFKSEHYFLYVLFFVHAFRFAPRILEYIYSVCSVGCRL